jgi:hypothetical protein
MKKKKIQMNKKKKIIGEEYDEAEFYSVRPTKVGKFDLFYFMKHMLNFGVLVLMI